MKYLLDTHVLVWWYENNPRLPKRYFSLLTHAEQSNEAVGVSIFSFWEIAKLTQVNRLQTTLSLEQWFEDLEEDPFVKKLSLTPSIILQSMHLGLDFPKDPADQLIVATARCHGLQLMTVDDRIIKSGVVAIV